MNESTPTRPLDTPHYSLTYGVRLHNGLGTELGHPHVTVLLPEGSDGTMALHRINGTPDDIRARLLESLEAFFEIYADASWQPHGEAVRPSRAAACEPARLRTGALE